jgi:hypothetical protein
VQHKCNSCGSGAGTHPETQLGADNLGNVILGIIRLQNAIIANLQQWKAGSDKKLVANLSNVRSLGCRLAVKQGTRKWQQQGHVWAATADCSPCPRDHAIALLSAPPAGCHCQTGARADG